MKRVIGSITATVISLVALLGFKTHEPEALPVKISSTTTTTSDTEESFSSPTTTAPQSGTSQSGTSKSTTSTTAKAKSSATKTLTGESVDTRWGPVQVQITMSGSTIKSIDVIDYPQNNNRDISINRVAVPALVSQALSAQSADIDGVSGATYTTIGFQQSLQSALNKA